MCLLKNQQYQCDNLSSKSKPQHTDLRTNLSLCKVGLFVDAQVDTSPEIARYRIRTPTARATTVSVATYA